MRRPTRHACAALLLAAAATSTPTGSGAEAGWRDSGGVDYWHRRGARSSYDPAAEAARRVPGSAVDRARAGPSATTEPEARTRGRTRTERDRACSGRFRSYDAITGTYLGYDGYRHHCH